MMRDTRCFVMYIYIGDLWFRESSRIKGALE